MIKTTPYANSLFEQPWWLDIVAPNQWVEFFSKDKKGEIVGRLACVMENNKIIMPPCTQNLGIWMKDGLNYSQKKDVINDIVSQILSVKSICLSLSTDNEYILPFKWLGFNFKPSFSYRIDDLKDCEKIYQNFEKKAKKNIKSAKNKVTIRTETNIDVLWDLLNKTFEIQNRRNPISKELVERIVNYCDENNLGRYFDAVDTDGNVHSCAYFVYDEKVCYYLFGASDVKYRNSGAQTLIIWEAIQFASKISRSFDFEGSVIEGIETFFRQFGGECKVYYTITKGSLLKDLADVLKPYIKKVIGYKV